MSSRPSSFPLTSPGALRLYSTTELLKMPAPEWLIKPLMPLGGFIALYGPSAVGKSFIAIDLSMHIATGRDWQGHHTQNGFVLYVAAEGGRGVWGGTPPQMLRPLAAASA